MKPLPHAYSVTAAAASDGDVSLEATALPRLSIAAPPEFDGPGDRWSPESLFSGAVASCFLLTFRAIARASKLQWTSLECDVEATLERLDGVLQFVRIVTRATLTAPASTSTVQCERALTRAEESCLVANSLRCRRELQMEIVRTPAEERVAG
jgi:organic hydroperoxide reductase OsmC/OhrA